MGSGVTSSNWWPALALALQATQVHSPSLLGARSSFEEGVWGSKVSRARLGLIHALGLPAGAGPRVPGGTGASTCVLGEGGKKTEEPSVSAESAEAGAVRRLAGAGEETWSLPPADNSAPHMAPTELVPKDHRRAAAIPLSWKSHRLGGGLRHSSLYGSKQKGYFI